MFYDKHPVLAEAIQKVYHVSMKMGTEQYTRYELNVEGFFRDIRGPISFDKTRLRNLSEKAVTKTELRVRQILPLIGIDGLLYMT